MQLPINPDFPVGNAAGWCKSIEEVRNLARSAAEFIVVGSITMEERGGNPGNTFNGESLNSLGLPNMGVEKLKEVGPEMVHIAHEAGKKIILSIAGSSPEEYEKLAKIAFELGFDGVEVNGGCPNVVEGGKRKPIACFDVTAIRMILWGVCSIKILNPPWFVSFKVSPMSNPLQIIEIAEVLKTFSIDAVVTQNTFPNGLLFNEDGSPQIQTPDKTGWAGFAGSAIKPMALGQVSQWHQALPDDIQVWGVGGVETGKDVRDMLRAGASMVQVGTAYFTQGPKIFSDIAEQYVSL